MRAKPDRDQLATPIIDDLATVKEDTGLCLLAIGDGFVCSFAMPASGEVVIGRSEDADISLDVDALSRRHAMLRIGETITIEDLASANGTFVHDARLVPGAEQVLSLGDSIEMGALTLILQQSRTSTRPRRIWTHGYFEARLEEQCARSHRTGEIFTVLRVKIVAREGTDTSTTDILFAAIRAEDIVASYGPDDYEVLMLGVGQGPTLDAITQRIHRNLRASGARVRVGIATSPGDGQAPEALMAKACAEVIGTPGNDTARQSHPVIIEAGVMKGLHRLVERVAAGSINVLLLGETGVGKEIFAERVHKLSPRVDKPLMRLNCAALTESLVESELFGHVKGAFTGAAKDKSGLFEAASGGTVFLDEIGDLPLALQAKLLRVLEDQKVRRVGSLEDRAIDIRVIAATHRDLEQEITKGSFRQDLFFRLNGISIIIPPLRDRLDELEPLARGFLDQTCIAQNLGQRPELSTAVLEHMRRYSWPGNVRELRNVMERAALLCYDGKIQVEHLPSDSLMEAYATPSHAMAVPAASELTPTADDRAAPPLAASSPAPAASDSEVVVTNLRDDLEARERALIIAALEKAGGNQTRAATLLGIPRRTLIDRIDSYGLPRPRKKSSS